MKRLILVAALATMGGCDNSSTTGTSSKGGQSGEPNIRVKESIGGGAGPVGAGRTREYEGPASTAPDWAKPKGR